MKIEEIDSPECPWPAPVKDRAKKVIELANEIKTVKEQMNKLSMMAPDKAQLMAKLSRLLSKQATFYMQLSKELAYAIASPKR